MFSEFLLIAIKYFVESKKIENFLLLFDFKLFALKPVLAILYTFFH